MDTQKSYDFTSKFDECWQTNDLEIWFNKMAGNPQSILNNNDLLTYEVLWDGSNTNGVISFIDVQELQKQLPLDVGGFIDVSFTSQENTKIGKPAPFSKQFYITSVTLSDGDSRGAAKIVTCNFIDNETQKLKSGFFNDSYDMKKPSDSFKEIFKKHKIEVEMFKDVTELATSILTPAHLSTFDFLAGEFSHRGYKLIQDRLSTAVAHVSNLLNSDAAHTGEFFEYKPSAYWTRFQVIEYNIEGFNINALENSNPATINSINNEMQNQKEMDVTTKESNPSGGKIGGVQTKDRQPLSGQKQKTSLNKNEEDVSCSLKDLQKMSVWVPGWNGNRLNKKVKIELPRPTEYDQNVDDPNFTGDWVVNKVRDKIIGSYFIQELFVSRAGA